MLCPLIGGEELGAWKSRGEISSVRDEGGGTVGVTSSYGRCWAHGNANGR